LLDFDGEKTAWVFTASSAAQVLAGGGRFIGGGTLDADLEFMVM
jgi:hypothetical protein